MAKRKTNEEFKMEMKIISPSIEVLGEYKNNKTKIEVQCKVCNKKYESTPDTLLRAKECKFCKREVNTKRQTKTKEQFVFELEKMNPTIKLISDYKGSLKKTTFLCKDCSYAWTTGSPVKLVKKDKKGRVTGCPRCKKVGKMTHEEFVEKAKVENKEIKVIGEFKARNQYIEVKCQKEECGHEWKMTGNNILKGRGCPKCCGQYIYSHEEYTEMVKKKNKNIEVVGLYTGMNENCTFYCKKHRVEFTRIAKTMTYNHYNCGCFICNHNASENEVFLYLKELSDPTLLVRQKTFDSLIGLKGGSLSYDFYIELGERKILIERQGQQHEKPVDYFGGEKQFEIQKEHDRIKRLYAKENGYELIEIWYYEDFKEKLKEFGIF